MLDQETTPGIGERRTSEPQDALDLLLEELRDFNDETRQQAALRLGELGDYRVVEPLLGRLIIDRSADVRLLVADALYKIGDARAWSTMAARITKDPDPTVRAKLADIFGLIGDQSLAPGLLPALTDAHEAVREKAALSLGILKSPAIIEDLIKGLRSSYVYKPRDSSYSSNQKVPAALSEAHQNALVFMGPMVAKAVLSSSGSWPIPVSKSDRSYYETYNKALVNGGYSIDKHDYILQDFQFSYRDEWFYLKGFYKDRVAILTELGSVAIRIIAGHIGSDQAPAIRAVATQTLGRFKEAEATRLLCKICQEDEVPAIRWLALEGMLNKDPKHIVESLVLVLQQDHDWRVRLKAAKVLGEVRSLQALAPLCTTAINDEQLAVRYAAIESLGLLRDAGATPTLGSIVWDAPDSNSRVLAVAALQAIGDRGVQKFLVSALGSDTEPEVRKAAAQALEEMSNPETLGVWLTVAEREDDASVQETFARILGKIGSETATKALTLLLQSKYSSVRLAAVKALDEIGSKEAATHLLSTLQGSTTIDNCLERVAVVEALTRIHFAPAVPRLQQLAEESNSFVYGDYSSRRYCNVGEAAKEAIKGFNGPVMEQPAAPQSDQKKRSWFR